MYIYIYLYVLYISDFHLTSSIVTVCVHCTCACSLPDAACNALTRYNTLQHAFTAMQLFVSQVVLCVSYGAKHARGPSFRLQWTSTSTMQAAWTNLPSLLSSIFSQKNQWPLELRRHSTLPLCVYTERRFHLWPSCGICQRHFFTPAEGMGAQRVQ